MKKLIIFSIAIFSALFAQAQIQLIKDINPGTAYGVGLQSPYQRAQIGDEIFFVGDDGQHGKELWVTDGTAVGTYMIADIWPGSGSGLSGFTRMMVMGDALYFSANDSLHGQELWKYEIGSGGPQLLADMIPGVEGSFPDLTENISAIVYKDRLYFEGSDKAKAEDREIWYTAGDSVVLLKDIYPGKTGNYWQNSFPGNYLVYKDHLYFSARSANRGREIWRTDGNPDSTLLFADIWPGKNDGGWNSPTIFQGEMYFVSRWGLPGSTQLPGYEIWKSDGTEAGTQLLKNIYPTGNAVHKDGRMVAFNQHLYFVANDSLHGFELWKTDGTEAGTQLLKDIHPWGESSNAGWGSSSAANQLEARVLNGKLYFMAFDPMDPSIKKLWETDGTEAGTQSSQVSWFRPMDLLEMTEFDGKFFGSGNDRVLGQELWWSNGTDPAQLVQDLYPGSTGSVPSSLFALHGRLVFTAFHPLYGNELMSIDPATVSVEEELAFSFQLYPNPATDRFYIKSEKRLAGAALYSLSGVKIQDFEVEGFSAVLEVPKGISGGLYLLRLAFVDGELGYWRLGLVD